MSGPNLNIPTKMTDTESVARLEVTPGRYLHFKGKEYEVLHIALDCDTQKPYVVYRALYGTFGVWLRSLEDFTSIVNKDGIEVQRFVRKAT